MTRWWTVGQLAIRLDTEEGAVGIGLRLSWQEPAIDVFFLHWMVGATTTNHMTWILENTVDNYDPVA